jgi:N utilization substance protein A
MHQSLVRQELLQVADAVAREKGILKAEVLSAMEEAFAKAARLKYGDEATIKATIHPKTGEICLARRRRVVESVENPRTEVSLREASSIHPETCVDTYLEDSLPPIDLGRMSVQVVRQVVTSLLRDAVRLHEYEEYKERVGEIVSGVVKSVDFGNVVLDLGRAEGFLRRDELIPRETFRPGDRVRAYIKAVHREARGPQILLSRTHPQFMAKLFTQEVPEIYDGLIEIKSVARDPGSRAKIAMHSKDFAIDATRTCVGVRGSRVQAVSQELGGEKIDIINWAPDLLTFVVNAMVPAVVTKVIMGEDERRFEVVVSDDQLSLAIGRRGQNVRLACELTGVSIDIITETKDTQRSMDDAKNLKQALVIDDLIAHLLVTEGFKTLEDVAYVPQEDFLAIEGFSPELVEELQKRARESVEATRQQQIDRFISAGGHPDLVDLIEAFQTNLALLDALANASILSIQDLADLSGEELKEVAGNLLSLSQGNTLVMAARNPEGSVSGGTPETETI